MAGTAKSIRAADGPAKKRRSIAKRAIIISLIALAAYVLVFGCCTKVTHVTYIGESFGHGPSFLWISRDESRNAAGYVAFWPLIHLLENTGRFEFVRRLPPEGGKVPGRLLILCFLDQF